MKIKAMCHLKKKPTKQTSQQPLSWLKYSRIVDVLWRFLSGRSESYFGWMLGLSRSRLEVWCWDTDSHVFVDDVSRLAGGSVYSSICSLESCSEFPCYLSEKLECSPCLYERLSFKKRVFLLFFISLPLPEGHKAVWVTVLSYTNYDKMEELFHLLYVLLPSSAGPNEIQFLFL